MKRNSNSKWYVSGLGVLLAISVSMLLLVGCSSNNPVNANPDNPTDNSFVDHSTDATNIGDAQTNPPVGFDKGGDIPITDRGPESACR